MTSISFQAITKRFAGVTALHDVSFAVRDGSCHAICGENGAGKSTLGRILAGLERADTGTVHLGESTEPALHHELARRVAMVHQELAFCDNLSVAENLSLGHLPRRGVWVDRAALDARAKELLAAVDARIDPRRPIHALSVAEQQQVQIAAALGAGAEVIVFDEPTSSLGERETARLYELIKDLRSRGVTIIYVSHRMPEIFALCDEVTVLRDGRHVSTAPTASLTEAKLVEQMIGRTLAPVGQNAAAIGEVRLRVDGLRRAPSVNDVSFSVHAGEIVGLAGLVGAGRSEIAETLFGLHPRYEGHIAIQGKTQRIRSPRDAMANGIGFVPEDRKRHGLVLALSAAENVTLPVLTRLSRWTWIRRAAEQEVVREQVKRLRVRGRPDMPAAAMSGGNQQKVVLAKWLAANADILMLDEPTRGVDVGAKAELHEWIEHLAAEGVAVLLISSELPELLRLSTRILVVRDGTIVAEFARRHASQEKLLRSMAGLN